MLEFRCTEEGFHYYDPILHAYIDVPNTLLFIIGYARVFGDSNVSDKLYIPNSILDSEGNVVVLSNQKFLLSIREYLSNIGKVECLDTGDLFELQGLSFALEQIGFFNFYKSSTEYNASLNRVPHVPLFIKRSQDYKRIYDILTLKNYWNTENKWSTEEEKEAYYGKPSAGNYSESDVFYSIYNPKYKGDRAEFLDLYKSFGSYNYLYKTLYPTEQKPVTSYADYCSWFIWESFSLTSLYQFSLGVLYGMSQLGWGLSPFMMRPTEYAPSFKYVQLVDEAFFWFQNTPFNQVGENALFNITPQIFRIDTYQSSDITTGRVLSSSVDQDYLFNTMAKLYSVDNGNTWLTKEEFEQWASLHNNALPVTSYISLYRGEDLITLPLSDWEW